MGRVTEFAEHGKGQWNRCFMLITSKKNLDFRGVQWIVSQSDACCSSIIVRSTGSGECCHKLLWLVGKNTLYVSCCHIHMLCNDVSCSLNMFLYSNQIMDCIVFWFCSELWIFKKKFETKSICVQNVFQII